MAKKPKYKYKHFPLTIGNDPSLWRFQSLHEALEANVNLIAHIIHTGEEIAQAEALAEEKQLNPAEPVDMPA